MLRCLDASVATLSQSLLERVGFFSFRNNMNKILNTVYSPRNEWAIAVRKPFADHPVIFLGIKKCSGMQRRGSRYRALRGAYCGRRFEALMLGSNPQQEEYCAVIKASLGNHRLLLSAEIDGKDTSTQRWVELKTSQIPHTDRARGVLERVKYSKWWVQSFLVGCPEVAVGFLDEGELTAIERIRTLDLPKRSNGAFEYARILNFGNSVLAWLRQAIGDSRSTHIMRYSPEHRRITLANANSAESPVDDRGLAIATRLFSSDNSTCLAPAAKRMKRD